MKMRLFTLFVLIIGLSLMSGTPGAVARGADPTANPAAAQEQSQHVRLVDILGGYMGGVTVQGNYAYIGVGYRFIILDVSDPAQPAVVGQSGLLLDSVRDIVAAGSYAYVAAAGAGLYIFNISNPAAPAWVGVCDTPGLAQGVALVGSYAYVADFDQGLRVVDISNPAAPTEIGFYDTPRFARGLAVAGSYAYVADFDRGLRVIDISDPAAPVEVGFYDPPAGESLSVAVVGDYAYLADITATGVGGGLRVVDISNPAAPTQVGYHSTECNWATDVVVAGDYAYVAAGGCHLVILDISEPTSPTLTSMLSASGMGDGVALDGPIAYVGNSYGLNVVDVSDPAAPKQVDFYPTTAWLQRVAVSDDYIYATAEFDGLFILQYLPHSIYLPMVTRN